ncbi:MAG: hypothetical protein WAN52_02230 [Pseudolabrys sp.]
MTSRTRTEIQSRAVKEGVFACPIAARTRRSLQSFVGDLFNMQEFFGLVVSAGFTHGNDPYYLMMPVGRSGAQFRTRLLFIAALSNLEIFMRIATRGMAVLRRCPRKHIYILLQQWALVKPVALTKPGSHVE